MEDQHNLNNAIEGELQQAAQYIRSQHLRDLVQTPDRAALCLQFEDLTVDCTRQPITLKILDQHGMLATAKSLPDLIDDLFISPESLLLEGQFSQPVFLLQKHLDSESSQILKKSIVENL